MRRVSICIAVIGGLAAAQIHAASLTLGTLLDSHDGTAWQASGTLAPASNWLVGAGAGRHDMEFNGAQYSGTSLGASTRVGFGGFFAGASGQHWEDSGKLTSLALHGELGWMSQSGLSVSALVADRSLRAPYSTTNLLGQTLAHESKSDGQGIGAALSWSGRGWSLGARFLDYRYKHRHEGVVAPIISVPDLLDELDTIGDDLGNIGAATPVLQLLEDAGLLGTVQGLLNTVGGSAGAALPPVIELTDDLTGAVPLPLPTVSELLNLGLFPRLQQLVGSPVTLVAGAPDRELAVSVGRQFVRTSLRADWMMQRDALTRGEVNVLSLSYGWRITRHLGVDATAGVADGGANGRVNYGGVSLTLRSAP